MSERDDIVERLMDYDRCHDGDVDEAADEINRLRTQLKALCDGVNVRCGCDINQLPLVSLESFTTRLAAAQEAARWLLYDAPGKSYTEVSEFVNKHPWLRLESEHGNSTRLDRPAS